MEDDDSIIPYVRPRIANACDGCKARKVKCDGKQPCSYCARRKRSHTCTYSPQKRRKGGSSRGAPTPASRSQSDSLMPDASSSTHENAGSPLARGGHGAERDRRLSEAASTEDDTEVPREARLVCDAQGKLIFIGDCAPLSFFQSVRQLVTTRVEPNAFAPGSSRFSVLEVAAPSQQHSRPANYRTPAVWANTVSDAVLRYLSITAGIVDLFENARLIDDVQIWASLDRKPQGPTSIINYLVLSIGLRTVDDARAEEYFEYARDRALLDLSMDLSVATVQAFTLLTMYMLCACQINGAFLYFGLAVRAAYSIGLHRSEVNARLGSGIHVQRDRLWKSLRILDLCLSTSMGRPPAISDVDCTVPYKADEDSGAEPLDLLNASVQILLVIEQIVEQIYSRRKISLQLTEGLSSQLREWAVTWLERLKQVETDNNWNTNYNGACQIMATYYYGVMLVSRPFLMYELYRNLDGPHATGRASPTTGKSSLADACIDSATLMVEAIQDGISRNAFTGASRTNISMPLLVPWLFAASLVLGVGLMGGFGRTLEKRCQQSIEALDHFAQHNAHAEQYSLISQSLLSVSLQHLERKEMMEQVQRKERSRQLFGLPTLGGSPAASPGTPRAAPQMGTPAAAAASRTREVEDVPAARDPMQNWSQPPNASPSFAQIDPAFFGMMENHGMQPPMDGGYWDGAAGSNVDEASTLNLFALIDSGGGIDLAHHL